MESLATNLREKIGLAEDCRVSLIRFIELLETAQSKIDGTVFKFYQDQIITPFRSVHRGVVELHDKKVMDEYIRIYKVAFGMFNHRSSSLQSLGINLYKIKEIEDLISPKLD